jgi:hypothetical protein
MDSCGFLSSCDVSHSYPMNVATCIIAQWLQHANPEIELPFSAFTNYHFIIVRL